MPISNRWLISLVAVLGACGGTTSSPDGATAPDAAGAADAAQVCTADGDACSLAGADALCLDGACAACLDGVDDDACAAAYPGSACMGGACVVPECTTPADCGGQSCVDGACVACVDDQDCNGGQVCDTATGVCGSAANACAGHGTGDACGPGGGDLCCNRNAELTCVDVECCGNDASTCPNPGSDTCEAGVCVPVGSLCDAPPNGEYWVDPGYTGVRTGSQSCPYITLHGAFTAVRTDDFAGATDVYVKGTINAAGEGAGVFPLSLPITAYVRNWPGAPDAVIVAPADTTAIDAIYTAATSSTTWSARVSHVEIRQATGGGAGGSGIRVSGGSVALPIRVDHVDVHGFFNGIHVETGGVADLNWGVNAHDNTNAGLRVGGGRVVMLVGSEADARSHYDHNNYGIWVTTDDTSVLDLTGADNAAGLKTVTASTNLAAGVWFGSPNPANTISHLGVVDNGGSGLHIVGDSKLKLRHANITGSGASGIRIVDNGTHTSLAGIDLGTLADRGFNTITVSTDSHVCVGTTYGTSHLTAEGNIYGAHDCTVASSPVEQVPMFLTCAGHGGGFNDGAPAFRESVQHCGFVIQ